MVVSGNQITIDLGDGLSVSECWRYMSALEIYNHLLAGMIEGRWRSTTERRLWALDVFRRRFSLRLGDLVKELSMMWPHWPQPTSAVLNVSQCCAHIKELFVRLEKSGRPAALDAWRPTTRRSQNIAADGDRIVRRFLDNSYGKPKATGQSERQKKPKGFCRIHSDRQALYREGCGCCYQRLTKLKAADILKSGAPQELVDALLRMPTVRGYRSSFFADARKLVAKYENR